jgi:ribosomal protein L7/L12
LDACGDIRPLIVLGLILLRAIAGRLNGIQKRLAVVSRIEAKLDLLLKHANIKFDPFADVSTDIVAALRRNQKIEAIKLYRQATGVGL